MYVNYREEDKKKRLRQGRRKNFAYDLTQKACNLN